MAWVIPLAGWAMAIASPVLWPRKFHTFWDGVCGVLEPGHERREERHADSGLREFTLLGTYKGYSVKARVVPYFDEWSYSARCDVCLRAGGSGPKWWNLGFIPGFWRGPGNWLIVAQSKELERRLEGAGLIAAAELALGLHQPYLIGISYADGRMCWLSDNTEPPDVEQFRRSLDFLVRLAAVNDRLNS